MNIKHLKFKEFINQLASKLFNNLIEAFLQFSQEIQKINNLSKEKSNAIGRKQKVQIRNRKRSTSSFAFSFKLTCFPLLKFII